jgi:hypothetical protein
MATDPPRRTLDPYHAERIPESKPMFGIGRPAFAAAVIAAIVVAVVVLILVFAT